MQKKAKYTILNGVIGSLAAFALVGCGGAEAPASNVDENVEIALKDVPANISSLVMANSPDFRMSEVMKKNRDGRTYYDVEGELPNGEEIEFDVLMTDDGPKIVEIQRDMALTATPQSVQDTLTEANKDNLKVVRVIESKQVGTEEIVFEIFVDGKPKDPYFEVSQTGNGPAKLLTKRSIH